MKKAIISIGIISFLLSAQVSQAALTITQANAILQILQAFGIDQSVIDNIRGILEPVAPIETSTTTPIVIQTPVSQPVINNPAPTMPETEITFDIIKQLPASDEFKNGDWEFKVSMTPAPKPTTPVTMTTSVLGAVEDENVNAFNETDGRGNFWKQFSFIPQKKGNYTIVFTSGDLTKTLNIVVD